MADGDSAVCRCGGELVSEGGQWFHARIEDFSHTPEPVDDQQDRGTGTRLVRGHLMPKAGDDQRP